MSQGPLFPTVGQNIATGDVPWNNPGNILLEDGVVASTSLLVNEGTEKLRGIGFGFSIPLAATIAGILLEIRRRNTGGTITDTLVSLLKAGVEVGANRALGGAWPGVLTYASYGGAADLWGTTWTPADINNASFGADLVCINGVVSSSTPAVDDYRITVFTSSAGVFISTLFRDR